MTEFDPKIENPKANEHRTECHDLEAEPIDDGPAEDGATLDDRESMIEAGETILDREARWQRAEDKRAEAEAAVELLEAEVRRLREERSHAIIDRHCKVQSPSQVSHQLEEWRKMTVRVLVLADEDVGELATKDALGWVQALEGWARRSMAGYDRTARELREAQARISQLVADRCRENAHGLELLRQLTEFKAERESLLVRLGEWRDWAARIAGEAPEPEEEEGWWRTRIRARADESDAGSRGAADLRRDAELDAWQAWMGPLLRSRGCVLPGRELVYVEAMRAIAELIDRLEADLTASEEFGSAETDRADRAEQAAALHAAACLRQEARATAAEGMFQAFLGCAQLIDQAVAELDNAVSTKRLGTSLRAIISAVGRLDQALVALRPALEQWVVAGEIPTLFHPDNDNDNDNEEKECRTMPTNDKPESHPPFGPDDVDGRLEERTRPGVGQGFDGTRTRVGVGPGLVPADGRDLLDEDPPDVEPMIRERATEARAAAERIRREGGVEPVRLGEGHLGATLVYTYRDDRARRVWEAAQPVGEGAPDHCEGVQVGGCSGDGAAGAQGLRKVQGERSDTVSSVQCGAVAGRRPEKRPGFARNTKHFAGLVGDDLLCAEGRTFGEESRSSCGQAVSGRENFDGCQNKAAPATFVAVRLAVRGLIRLLGRFARGGVA